jgi:hypothetical protein
MDDPPVPVAAKLVAAAPVSATHLTKVSIDENAPDAKFNSFGGSGDLNSVLSEPSPPVIILTSLTCWSEHSTGFVGAKPE